MGKLIKNIAKRAYLKQSSSFLLKKRIVNQKCPPPADLAKMPPRKVGPASENYSSALILELFFSKSGLFFKFCGPQIPTIGGSIFVTLAKIQYNI